MTSPSHPSRACLRQVGNLAQLGGTRHYTLNEGRSRGISAIDANTGAGFCFTVLPDRGLDISRATYRGTNLVYLTPNGEVHPAYYEPEGFGWLRTFFGGLLTTCGLTTLGAPGPDGDEDLGLHGRYATSPAMQVCDNSGWHEDEYRIQISGVVEECVLFGNKIRLSRTISTTLGSKTLAIEDVAENFGYRSTPFAILYHINAGYPLLDANSELVLTAEKSEPFNDLSAQNMDKMRQFSEPIPGYEEQNYLHTMAADHEGYASAALINRALGDGLALTIRADVRALPYLNQWKMMGEGDYALGIEPCAAPCANRVELREKGLLPTLEPGEKRTMRVEIGVLDGQAEIDAFLQRTHAR